MNSGLMMAHGVFICFLFAFFGDQVLGSKLVWGIGEIASLSENQSSTTSTTQFGWYNW